MNAKNTLLSPLAAGTAALLIALFTPATNAHAGHNTLYELSHDLEEITHELQCEFIIELKYSGRWTPCGIDERLFNAFDTAAERADRIMHGVSTGCGIEELNRYVCEARTAITISKNLLGHARLSRNILSRVAQTDRLLCAIETEVAERAAHAAHAHAHAGHAHGVAAHQPNRDNRDFGHRPPVVPPSVPHPPRPVFTPPAPPAHRPAPVANTHRADRFETHGGNDALRLFVGAIFQDHRRR